MPYQTTTIPTDVLRTFIADIFTAAGCERPEGEQIAYHLLSANLTGHDSHGVIRTPRYITWLQEGKVRAGQTLTVVHETLTQAIVDGNYGFGQTIGPLAVDFGINKAKQVGVAAIGLRNAGHIGRTGDWAERAAAAGLISIHFVNVQAGELVRATARSLGLSPPATSVPNA